MRGTVIVYENESQFLELFYEPAIHAILNPPADPVLRGEVEIQNYICNSCHILDSLGWTSTTGPTLNGIADRAGERVPGQSAEEYIATSIWNSGAFRVPGYDQQMAAFGPDVMETANVMSPEQLYSIVAYLCTQGEPPIATWKTRARPFPTPSRPSSATMSISPSAWMSTRRMMRWQRPKRRQKQMRPQNRPPKTVRKLKAATIPRRATDATLMHSRLALVKRDYLGQE